MRLNSQHRNSLRGGLRGGGLMGVAVSCLLVMGCSGRPSRIRAPKWDPEGFASAVIEKLDTNGDGQIDESELASAPGLAFGARFIDANSDGSLSRDELIQRFQFYVNRKIGLTTKELQIFYKGRPLSGAQVKLVPEFFLIDLLETAEGVTDQAGSVFPAIQNSEFRMPVMRTGYYRMQVTSPTVELPPKFNTATTVGVEVSPASDDMSTYGPIKIRFNEKSR